MAQEASPNPGQDKQKMIEGANADAASLRKSLKRQEEHRKTLLHPTLEQADNVISAYDNTIRDYTSELSRMQKELEKARANNDEEGVKWTLDRMGSHKLTVNVLKEGANHYRLARAKLVNSDTGLVADLIDVGDLSETVFAKKQMGTINKLKAELAKKEQEIQALEGVSIHWVNPRMRRGLPIPQCAG